MTNIHLTPKNFIDLAYPSPAPGWIDGIFHPRHPVFYMSSTHLTFRNDMTALHNRIWKETEETGFGIYVYEETALLEITLPSGFYKITVTLANPTDRPLPCYIKSNGIVKLDSITVPPGHSSVHAFFTSVLSDSLQLGFHYGCYENLDTGISEGTVYVKQVTYREMPAKEPNALPHIYLASDSTVQQYSDTDRPQMGWGEMLSHYVDLPIKNHAIGGRSSRSFIAENRLDAIFEHLAPDDFLFVQFGHNDVNKERPNRYVSPETFHEFLQPFIIGCRLKGATCVLVTPIARRNCDEYGAFQISFPKYRNTMLKTAETNTLPLLDLGKATTAFLRSLTSEISKSYYMWIPEGIYDHEKYRNGLMDNTHLNEKGADAYASILSKLIFEYNKDNQLDPIKKRVFEEH